VPEDTNALKPNKGVETRNTADASISMATRTLGDLITLTLEQQTEMNSKVDVKNDLNFFGLGLGEEDGAFIVNEVEEMESNMNSIQEDEDE